MGSARLNNVGLLVLDEVHYLGDPERGTVWEEVVISCLPHMRLLAMSATIANARQLGGWLSQVCLSLVQMHLELEAGLSKLWGCSSLSGSLTSLLATAPVFAFTKAWQLAGWVSQVAPSYEPQFGGNGQRSAAVLGLVWACDRYHQSF